MSVVDAIVVVLTLAMAVLGWELGLVRSALPLAGFVAGAVIGGRIGPAVLAGGTNSAYAPVASLVGGLLGGALFAAALDPLGFDLRRRLGRGRLVAGADRLAGATLLAVLALLMVWAFGAVVREAADPGSRGLRTAINDSSVIAALDGVLPPSGPILNLLRRVDAVPTVTGPSARVPPPASAILRSHGVEEAGRSAVKVVGSACGLGLEGSGWVARPGIVVTNAHVVAGESDTAITTRDDESFGATVVGYDPRNDIAVLRVPGLGLPSLPIEQNPRAGTAVAVLGYPENGPFAASPARLGQAGDVATQDSYGRGPIRRTITPFRGEVRSGNSGSPAVDAQGRVATMVFAANEGGQEGGLGVPDELVRRALDARLAPTSTGPCR
jgi:S1-C subfamily serine protease